MCSFWRRAAWFSSQHVNCTLESIKYPLTCQNASVPEQTVSYSDDVTHLVYILCRIGVKMSVHWDMKTSSAGSARLPGIVTPTDGKESRLPAARRCSESVLLLNALLIFVTASPRSRGRLFREAARCRGAERPRIRRRKYFCKDHPEEDGRLCTLLHSDWDWQLILMLKSRWRCYMENATGNCYIKMI